MQSTSLHLAIIMDGNGRWAARRGLPRELGHRAGADAVRRVVEAAPDLGVGVLTLYAFSSDNWQRPAREVAALLDLFADYLATEGDRCRREGVRLGVIGRRDRLPPALREAIGRTESATAQGRRLWLRLAIDYSARDQILLAAQRAAVGGPRMGHSSPPSRERFRAALASAGHDAALAPDVDLLIRTGGERRLSDFLLWESAYAELLFLDLPWPDFGAGDLAAAISEFHRRDRRFGRIAEGGSA